MDSAKLAGKSSWCVVGGGMLGLSVAWRLLDQGQDVTIMEAGDEIGGLAGAWQLGKVTWDRFYHVTLLSDLELRRLLDELHLDDQLQWVQTKTGFYSDGQLYSLSSSLDFLKFPPLTLYQKFRLGSTIFYASKLRNWRRLEQIPVDRWLTRCSGRKTFEKIWLPLLKAKLGEAYRRTSAAFIWAYIDRMYKARRSGMKREMFGYVPGGYRRILKSLGEGLRQRGATLRTASPVNRVHRSAGGRILVEFGREGAESQQEFDQVIMTTPSPMVARVCQGLDHAELQRLNRTEYLGVVCTSLLLSQPLGGYYVTNIIDSWVPLTGIIEMGTLVDPKQLDGNYLVYLPRYLLSDDPGFQESEEVIHERCLVTLERMYPAFQRSQVRAIQTAKARHVMAIPTLDYSQQLPPVVSSVPGLYLLNSSQITQGTLNVNETIRLAESELVRSIVPDVLRRASANAS